MRGEALTAAQLTLQGIPADRRYAFVQKASRSAFPWLTARELPDMLRYCPSVDESNPQGVRVSVTDPEGKQFAVDSPELLKTLESRSGRELFLLHDGRGSYDTAPISIITSQTIARIGQETGVSDDAARFRPNLVIDLDGYEAFGEMDWVGRILRIGDTARIGITKWDQRCMIVNLDPVSAEANPAVLRYVVQKHNQYAGVYGVVITPGETQVGDTVSIED
jgi:hypothetical protein